MNNAMRFQGKTAIVTGAGFGIGRSVALRLAREGAKVGILDLNISGANETVEAIRNDDGAAMAVKCDIRDGAQIKRGFEEICEGLGDVEILVNNAGGMIGTMTGRRLKDTFLADMEEEGMRIALEVNLLGTMLVTQAALPGMFRVGHGKVVNIASVAGVNGIPRMTAYSAAKGGVIAFTRALAIELGGKHINVNSIAPGSIWTYGGSPDTFLGRVGQPEEVANLVAFLASEESDFITGQNYAIDGGRTISMKCYEVN